MWSNLKCALNKHQHNNDKIMGDWGGELRGILNSDSSSSVFQFLFHFFKKWKLSIEGVHYWYNSCKNVRQGNFNQVTTFHEQILALKDWKMTNDYLCMTHYNKVGSWERWESSGDGKWWWPSNYINIIVATELKPWQGKCCYVCYCIKQSNNIYLLFSVSANINTNDCIR